MIEETKNKLINARAELGSVIRGKDDVIELLLIAILSGGHVLLEDMPGVGKTTLAKALARSLDMDFTRVQFTPDLLPMDLLGMSVLNPQDGTFSFHKGPIFSNLLLADEINRASPRTQSALLEAMNEGQVTTDNATRPLPSPFFVVATQNPVDYQGTYPLPEAQLDRFLMKLSLGYPAKEEELRILFDRQLVDPIEQVKKIFTHEELLGLQADVRQVAVEEDVGRYILRIINATRNHPDLEMGASPRASLALFRASQARAFVLGRSYVSPDDVQALFMPVIEHRVVLNTGVKYGGTGAGSVLNSIIENQDIPV